MATTRLRQHVNAPRAAVYRACLDASAVARWMVPDGMTSKIHTFEPHVGGAFRISLSYDAPDKAGKSSAHTDTFHGRFETLVPDDTIIQTVEFETDDPALRGQMTITMTLVEADGGTDIVWVHDGLPDAVPVADNEAGSRMSLAKLAAIAEGR